MAANNLDVRVYPIDEPKGSTLAFASVSIDDIAAIRGIRLVNGSKGLFVAMPQSQDNTGVYHDIAFPLNGNLRKEITATVIDEFVRQSELDAGQRGYDRPKQNISDRAGIPDVKLDIKVFPLSNPQNGTLAFASVGMDDVAAIRGIRVVDGNKGHFVSMPQSKDKDGNFHDVAFPLSGELRRSISNGILAEYRQMTAERKQAIGTRLADGKVKAAQYSANMPERTVAKRPPGLGD